MTAALRILRARTSGLGPDRLRSQLALQRLMADAEPDRLLPPSAILVARRARMILPPRGAGRPAASLDDTLRPLIAGAARPARGFVPAGAEAVLFDDEVELLACLASAFAAGVLASQWWWTGLLRGRLDLSAVSTAWLERPQAIAAAFELLERRGETARVLRALGETFAREVAQSLAATHEARTLASPPLAPALAASSAPAVAGQAPSASAPWAALGLTAETLSLPAVLQWPAALAVSLRRAPSLARSPAFAIQAKLWWAAAGEADPPPAAPVDPRSSPSIRFDLAEDYVVANDLAPKARPDLASGPSTADRAIHTLPASEPDLNAPAATPSDAALAAMVAVIATNPLAAAAPPALATPRAAPDAPLATPRAGLLFLLNAALAMDLWGDFSAPQAGTLPIDPWTWLSEMGLRFCGDDLKADPIWPVLRDLGADVAFGMAPPHPPARLLNAQARLLRARLCAALGVRGVRGVRRLLLQRPGDLWVSAARIDAAFDLASHPVAVRASGLDRDPGWIPAAGRDVRFHFR
ncbi:hypothetical protein [Phenylobacterium immobile]|uniref:hypothetical protein n=1 Tax=Phenylobacterium immobile TaxID=21 RepID=UPI000A8946BA|nr:hypothetical protein [Phenylobacterium immobile]